MEQMHHEKIGGRILQELRGEVCKLFMHSPPKFLQVSDFKAKMHQIDFGWGSAPDPAGGAYSAPPDPLARYKRAYF